VRVVEERPEAVVVELTRSEIVILSNAVNEICHGPDAIEEWEFATRVGATPSAAIALLDRLSKLS
jgi:hypothetical protein